MYPAELDINDITESTTSASYLDLLLSIGQLVNFTLQGVLIPVPSDC